MRHHLLQSSVSCADALVGTCTLSKRFACTPAPSFFAEATIGSLIFVDANANGTQDTGELGLAGVTVKLYKGSDVVQTSQVTDSSGAYSFRVDPGTYSVQFVLPSGQGYIFSSKTGPVQATDSHADANGATASVTVTSGDSNNDLDAGAYLSEHLRYAGAGGVGA